MTRTAAVVCAAGIGDALIMMIASHQLQKQGYEVTTFSNYLGDFQEWVQSYQFSEHPSMDQIEKVFAKFDVLFLQHENSDRARAIFDLRKKGVIKELYCFYNNYRTTKHDPLNPEYDFAFDESQPMADNLAIAMQKIFKLDNPSKEVGLCPPEHLVHRHFEKRVCFHPTSSSSQKNWPAKKFLKLARKLQYKGYQPAFLVSPKERKDWTWVIDEGFDLPLVPSLADLANYIYESGYFIGNDSGPGHLASCLHIPLLILAPLKQSISHWQPGWKKADIILPPSWAPNLKGFRLRESNWHLFVSVSKVLSRFKNLTSSK